MISVQYSISLLNMASYFHLYLLVTLMFGGSGLSDETSSLFGAYLPGDVIIGILNSVHRRFAMFYASNRPNTQCKEFNVVSFVQSLAVIQTIETINNSSFLPGIRLGYRMCDTCACAAKALHCVEHVLAVNGSLPVLSDYTHFNSPVKAFVGDRFSELSISVAKLLSLYMIPQVSCTSSAPTLSDKLRYPSFLRVIPNDIYQTQALAKLMRHFSWDWVGVLTLDDDYGNAALENFLLAAEQEKVCVEFKKVLPNIDVTEMSIKKAADLIRSSSARVVLLILGALQVEMLFKEMIKTNTSRTWLASDAWSLTGSLMEMKDINKVGDILGFTFITGEIPGFKDYLQNLQPSAGGWNDFITEYKELRFKCPSASNSTTNPSSCNGTNSPGLEADLLDRVELRASYSQRVAVYAIAHALKKILECNNTACPGDTNFPIEKLVAILREINFTLDNQTYSFNKDGDFETGYNLVMWKNASIRRIPIVVGKYLINEEDVEVYDQNITWFNNTVSWSRCSETCPPGTRKSVSNISCCYTCIVCAEGFFSNMSDQDTCQTCPNGTSSLENSTRCKEWEVWYLKWSDPHPVVVMIATGIGIFLLIFSFIFFILHKENLFIKSTLVSACIMKFGLLVSFIGILMFLGRPSTCQCIAQQAMYGLGFTLCVSCILMKAFQTFIAYIACDPHTQHRLRKIDKPFVIIGLLTALQGVICIIWFVLDKPDVEKVISKSQPLTMNHLCTQGASMIGFGAMHTYIAVLAVVCFLLAFKGRDSETDSVVFSMLIHLFAWLCFIPIFITQHDLGAIIQISAIMVSNYGVIFCHFTPKWFRIFSEKMEHRNTVKITSSQSTKSSLDSAIGSLFTAGSVASISLSHPVFSTLPGPSDAEISIWDSTTSASLSEQHSSADDEMSYLDCVTIAAGSGKSMPTLSTISTLSSIKDVGVSCRDLPLCSSRLEDAALTAIGNTAQIIAADSEMPICCQNTVSIRRRRTRSF